LGGHFELYVKDASIKLSTNLYEFVAPGHGPQNFDKIVHVGEGVNNFGDHGALELERVD